MTKHLFLIVFIMVMIELSFIPQLLHIRFKNFDLLGKAFLTGKI